MADADSALSDGAPAVTAPASSQSRSAPQVPQVLTAVTNEKSNEELNSFSVRSNRSNLVLFEDDSRLLALSTYLTRETNNDYPLSAGTGGHVSFNTDSNKGGNDRWSAASEPRSPPWDSSAMSDDGFNPDDSASPLSPGDGKRPGSAHSAVGEGARGSGAGRAKARGSLGVWKGVFFPCFQNITGIILFVRLAWIVGVAGIGQTTIIAIMCTLCTLLTVLSLSAISTNGRVPSGGAYYMISRSLGPNWGGSVGVLFYLSNVVAAVLYVLGAIEIVVNYLLPGISLGDPATDARVYGTATLFVLACIVMVGIGLVNKTAMFFLTAVLAAIFASLIGLLASNRLNIDGIIGFPGNFTDNFSPGYTKKDVFGMEQSGETFYTLFAIFFPSVTGIMAGSNRSGDLADPAVSIPKGTLAAQVVTSSLYFIYIALFGTVISGDLLRTKTPPGGLLISQVAWPHPLVTTIGCLFATLAAGLQCFVGAPRLLQAISKDDLFPVLRPLKTLSTPVTITVSLPQFVRRRYVGFARQGLTILPGGEPRYALLVTFIIAECAMLIGSLDLVAPILTMLYLICYLFVNLSTALLGFLKEPNWRPSWKYYHWSVSTLAAVICLSYMFLISWIFALISLTVMAALYKYIEYHGCEVHWGDGIQSFHLHIAQQNLMKIERNRKSAASNGNVQDDGDHTKNWRPQILAFLEFDPDSKRLKFPKMLAFLSQLRKSGGLTIVSTVLAGDLVENHNSGRVDETRECMQQYLNQHKLMAFTEVVVAPDKSSGLSVAMQCSGIGVLRPNTVLLGFPTASTAASPVKADQFVNLVKQVIAYDKALLILKNPQLFPSNKDIQSGEIHVYWVYHDGGILTLLPYLLRKHRVWRGCKLRVFAVAQLEDNSVAMKAALEVALRQLRIDAVCDVLELGDYDVSEFAYERTVRMQERQDMLRKLSVSQTSSTGMNTDLATKSTGSGNAVTGTSATMTSSSQQGAPSTTGWGTAGASAQFADSAGRHNSRKSFSGAQEWMRKMRSRASIGSRRDLMALMAQTNPPPFNAQGSASQLNDNSGNNGAISTASVGAATSTGTASSTGDSTTVSPILHSDASQVSHDHVVQVPVLPTASMGGRRPSAIPALMSSTSNIAAISQVANAAGVDAPTLMRAGSFSFAVHPPSPQLQKASQQLPTVYQEENEGNISPTSLPMQTLGSGTTSTSTSTTDAATASPPMASKGNTKQANQMLAPPDSSNSVLAAQMSRATTMRQRALDKRKVDMMNTSIKLNTLIREHSSDAKLILMNLPAPSPRQTSLDWIEYLNVLTQNLSRVVLVKGNGREVVTSYF